jgi:hypothetical protein
VWLRPPPKGLRYSTSPSSIPWPGPKVKYTTFSQGASRGDCSTLWTDQTAQLTTPGVGSHEIMTFACSVWASAPHFRKCSHGRNLFSRFPPILTFLILWLIWKTLLTSDTTSSFRRHTGLQGCDNYCFLEGKSTNRESVSKGHRGNQYLKNSLFPVD